MRDETFRSAPVANGSEKHDRWRYHNGAVAAAVAFTGPGQLSLDWMLGLSLAGAKWGLIALILGVLGALPPLRARAASTRQSAAT